MIEDFGFRTFEGNRVPVPWRMLHLSRAEIRRFFKNRRFLLFYVLCISPAIVQLVMVYVLFVVREGQAELAGMGDIRMPMGGPFMRTLAARVEGIEFLFQPLIQHGFPLVIMFSAVVCSGLLSRDRAANALELYFTRGIRPIHYFAGKWLAAFFMMLAQVCLPFVGIWLAGIFLSPDWGFFERTIVWIPRFLLATGFFAAAVSWFATALSLSSSSPRFSVIRWFGGLFVLFFLGNLLRRLFGDPNWLAVSPYDVWRRIAEFLADSQGRLSFDMEWALTVFLVLILFSLVWVHRHLKPVEVVG